MAVTGTNYFNNAIVGQPMAGADFNIYDVDTLPKYAVGTGFTRSDGNKYRYVHYGAATDMGEAVATDRSESNISGANCIQNPTSAGKPDFENINMGAVGSHYIQANLTITNNQVAGGYLMISSPGTGEGQEFRIRGNTSWNGSTTRIELYEPIQIALDQTSDPVIVGSPYANVEPATTAAASTGDSGAVGVSVRGGSAANYGWVCTHGITRVAIGANVTAGQGLIVTGPSGWFENSLGNTNPNATDGNARNVFMVGRALNSAAVAASYTNAYVQFE